MTYLFIASLLALALNPHVRKLDNRIDRMHTYLTDTNLTRTQRGEGAIHLSRLLMERYRLLEE